MIDYLMDDAILVNTNLTIDQPGGKIKRHECDISVSWGIPVIAAYYVRALNLNPEIEYEKFYDICKNSLKEGTKILDEGLFMENIKKLEQEKINNSQISKKSLVDDYQNAVEDSRDLSYRLNSLSEITKIIKSDIIRADEKKQSNNNLNKE